MQGQLSACEGLHRTGRACEGGCNVFTNDRSTGHVDKGTLKRVASSKARALDAAGIESLARRKRAVFEPEDLVEKRDRQLDGNPFVTRRLEIEHRVGGEVRTKFVEAAVHGRPSCTSSGHSTTRLIDFHSPEEYARDVHCRRYKRIFRITMVQIKCAGS